MTTIHQLISFAVPFTLLMQATLVQPALAAADLTKGLYSVDIPVAELNEIQGLLPDSGVSNPAFIGSATDPNIHLIADAGLTLTFLGEGTPYKNSFGYFLYDDDENILSEQTIFKNASAKKSSGKLLTGGTVSLGDFDAGSHLGFWLKPPNKKNSDGVKPPKGVTYYSLDQYNPDGLRHIAIFNDPKNERLVIGFEDLYNPGALDYNDVVFAVSANPFDAIDTSMIPTGSPEAGPLATALIGLGVFGLIQRRKRRRKDGVA